MITCGRQSFPNGIAFNSVTQENFTIAVNSGTGTDPTVPTLITTQAEATARGTFASIPAAIASLPQVIKHVVTITLPDGVTQLDARGLGDITRFVFEDLDQSGDTTAKTPGQIVFTYVSATGWVTAPTTTSYTIQSIDTVQNAFTLNADPGFVANTYRTYFYRILSGTGAGSYRPIRSHTGAVFKVAGDVAGALNSVIEICTPAVTIRTSAGGYNLQPQKRRATTAMLSANVVFRRVGITGTRTPTDYVSMSVTGGSVSFDSGCRFIGVLSALQNACIEFSNVVVYKPVSGSFGAITLLGGAMAARSNSSPLFVYAPNNTYTVYAAGTTYERCTIMVYGRSAFTGATWASIGLEGMAIFYNSNSGGTAPINDNGPPYAVDVWSQSQVVLMSIGGIITGGLFGGTSGDISLDGIGTTWAAIAADPTNSADGPFGSVCFSF